MSVDPAVLVGVLGVIGTIGGSWIAHRRGRGERAAAEESMAAAAALAVQDVYQGVITDLQAQVSAAGLEASSARAAAREAQRQAQAAEETAWRAETAMRAMQRFLAELRPLIEAYVPESAALVDRLDRLAGLGSTTTT